MIKVSKKIEYALMILKYMMEKSEGELTRAREVCKHFHVPFDTAAKVMQELNNAGVLISVKGAKGGYYLHQDLNEINFFDLNRILEGPSFGEDCHGPRSFCDQYSMCNIIGPLSRLNNKLIEFYKGISLKDLLSCPSRDVVPLAHSPLEFKMVPKKSFKNE